MFIERAAAKVYKLTMDALLADVDKRLTPHEEHEEFIRPTDLARYRRERLCESYERLLSSYHYLAGE